MFSIRRAAEILGWDIGPQATNSYGDIDSDTESVGWCASGNFSRSVYRTTPLTLLPPSLGLSCAVNAFDSVPETFVLASIAYVSFRDVHLYLGSLAQRSFSQRIEDHLGWNWNPVRIDPGCTRGKRLLVSPCAFMVYHGWCIRGVRRRERIRGKRLFSRILTFAGAVSSDDLDLSIDDMRDINNSSTWRV